MMGLRLSLALGDFFSKPPQPAPPVVEQPQYNTYFVSSAATGTGDGTWAQPWTNAQALAAPLGAGSRVLHRGGSYALGASYAAGVYRKPGLSHGGGSAGQVRHEAYGRERVTWDGRLRLDQGPGGLFFKDIEVTFGHPKRFTTDTGSDPADILREDAGVFVTIPNVTLAHVIAHDLGDGLYAGSPATQLKLWGYCAYNNGWHAPDRGHGHSLYLQNEVPSKEIIGCVLFQSFSTGIKIGGTEMAGLRHFVLAGNASFESGAPSSWGRQQNFHIEGGGGDFGDVSIVDDSYVHAVFTGQETSFSVNNFTDPPGSNLSFLRMFVQGRSYFGAAFNYSVTFCTFSSGGTSVNTAGSNLVGLGKRDGVTYASHIFNNNRYVVPADSTRIFWGQNEGGNMLMPAWRTLTGYDLNSTVLTSLSAPEAVYKKSPAEAKRGTVHVKNPQALTNVSLDLSMLDFVPGDTYEIRHAYNLFDAPVVSGTYTGSAVLVPQTGYVPPVPFGDLAPDAPALVSTSPTFNVFVVRTGPPAGVTFAAAPTFAASVPFGA